MCGILSVSSVLAVALNTFNLYNRVVERKEGEELAKSLNCAFTEASAKDNENVARIFELMVGEVEKCAYLFLLYA